MLVINVNTYPYSVMELSRKRRVFFVSVFFLKKKRTIIGDNKPALVFDVNHLLAEDSHEMPCLSCPDLIAPTTCLNSPNKMKVGTKLTISCRSDSYFYFFLTEWSE